MAFRLDPTHLERDPNLAGFVFEAGNLANAHKTDVGGQIEDLLVSRFAVACLRGSISAAPTKPPMPAIEDLLYSQLGDRAFTREMKQLTGRIIRQIVEYLGGKHVQYDITIRVTSRYKKGSTYSFPDFQRR